MKSIFLFGPFIGSLSWEFYRFSPYAIFMKRKNPTIEIAVLTRPERFDLYGKYVNFLLPLKIKKDNIKNQICFKLKNFDMLEYNKLINQFRSMYEKRFNIINHFYPDIIDYRYKLRWQFPRFQMNYDFKPRINNYENIKPLILGKKIILITPPYDTNFMKILISYIKKNKLNKKYQFLTCDDYNNIFKNINNIPININTSRIGYLIEIIKKSRLVIGPKSDLTHLALLLKCTVVSWGNWDNLNLINPLGTNALIYNEISYKSIENILNQELEKKKKKSDYECF